jgi:hypothetical protein
MPQSQKRTREPEKPFTFEDEELTCCDCRQSFVFTVGEQEFYSKKGFSNRPRRCKECHQKHKAAKDSQTPRR